MNGWRLAASLAALTTAWWHGNLRGRMRGSTAWVAAISPPPPVAPSTGATGTSGNGEVKAGDVAWVAEEFLVPSPEPLVGELTIARSAARVRALQATTRSLASLGTALVEEGNERAGEAVLDAASHCLDGIEYLA